MVFFTDRDLGKNFPTMLREAGVEVEMHSDHFNHDAKDEFWITEAGRRGWFCVSRNKDIRYKKNQTEAVMRAKVGLFLLIGPKATHPKLAENFIITFSKIERFAEKNKRPFIARIYRATKKHSSARTKQESGRVKLWLNYEQWQLKPSS